MATITLRPTLKQHYVYEALKVKDEVFFGGAAGGGKSWMICESRLINCFLYPGYKSYIGREELKSLMKSTYLTWVKVCAYHKVPRTDWKLNGQYNYIEFVEGKAKGSRIDLLDLKYQPSDPLFERLGSLEYSDGAIEEAGEIDFLAYDVLKSRVGRHMNEIIRPTTLITGNPKKNWTYKYFYKPHKEKILPESQAFIQALYTDNPYTADSYKAQLSKIVDKALKERLMFGNWEYDDDPNVLITYDQILDLFTNNIDENPELFMVCDVARYGRDKTVISIWKGYDCILLEEHEKTSIPQTINRLKELSNERKIPFSHIVVDEDGVGGGVVDGMRGVKGFVNNSRPFDNPFTDEPDNYNHLKSQCYFLLAEIISSHKMKISATIGETQRNNIIEELEQVKQQDMDKDGKRKIITKDKVKELIGRSPDYSDNLMMRMYFALDAPVSVLEQFRERQQIQNIKANKRTFR